MSKEGVETGASGMKNGFQLQGPVEGIPVCWAKPPEGHFCRSCHRREAVRMPRVPRSLHPEWHLENTHRTEAQRECPQVPVSALRHRHRKEE